jgi:ATP-dependent 26S proteasome regulatory subunit
MTTNRQDTLDPALLRPTRLDRNLDLLHAEKGG